MFLSIIIPAYNSQETIVPLLQSIKDSKRVDLKEIEVIIVDDCSTDKTVEIVEIYSSKAPKRGATSLRSLRSLRVAALRKNQGPAKARNEGVKQARGKVVLFLDADVLLYKNTLFEIVRSFKDDPDLFAMTGVWDKKQKSNKFFPKFKALRDWSYWINEKDPKNYYYLFSTRVAAIDRGLFLRLGGFDTTYKHALVEDIELTYRITKRYAVVFNQKAIVRHEFEDFWPVAKKYFWRSFYWSKIYRERKKFDPVATTGKEAVTTISAGGVVVFSVLALISYLSNLSDLSEKMLIGLVAVGIIHLIGVRKFLWFVAKEEGIVFAIKSFFVGIALYIAILAGAASSLVTFPKKTS